MTDFKKNIRKFNNFKNRSYKSLSIVGGGRWAQIYLIEIIKNFKNIKKVYIYTNHPQQIGNLIKKKKFDKIEIKKLNKLKKVKSKYFIIANKNKDHIKFAKFLISLKCNILVEKIFPLSLKDFQKLLIKLKKNKVNLFLSSQYFFANYFYFIKKRIIKINKIKKINIKWYDAVHEKRNGQLKKHDLKVNFLEDIFYHLNSILNIFLGNGIIDIREKVRKINNLKTVNFLYKDSQINVRFTRVAKKRKRELVLFFKKNKITINFSNDKKVIVKYDNQKIQIPNFVCHKTLKFQILDFLNSNHLNSKTNVNSLFNLKNLFISLNKLKKYIK
tara:strand:+ start:6596 stop:7582 length:987 start_codon:yes stop_codon:yes gene_type:complete